MIGFQEMSNDARNPFEQRRVALGGKLESMTQREAHALIRRLGGVPVASSDARIDLVLVGDLHSSNSDGTATLTETQLWQQLGVLENAQQIKRLFTPLQLAQMSGVDASTIRRWHRAGLLSAAHVAHRLPYFGFAEIGVARRLRQLLQNGASLASIGASFRQLQQRWPHVARPAAELPLRVEGRRLLVDSGEALTDVRGQRWFEWSEHSTTIDEETASSPVLSLGLRNDTGGPSPMVEQMIASAEEFDQAGDLPAAADMYRSALAAAGPDAAICFQLAECLYRLGDLSASRERYSMAIEIDESYVEARANLGCVLAELGSIDLAIAALEGALTLHPDFADAHYHLARLLATVGRDADAARHRSRFEQLAPESPWGEAFTVTDPAVT